MAVKSMSVIGLGSTGEKAIRVGDSLGIRTKATACYGNRPDRVIEHILRDRPERVGIVDMHAAAVVWDAVKGKVETEIIPGPDAVLKSCVRDDVDTVFNATVGVSGLIPTIETLKMGMDVRLVNKQSLVVGGAVVMETARAHGAKVMAVDSEHAAASECLEGEDLSNLTKLIITMSGGALRDLPPDMLKGATPKQALAHPNWEMGPDVTIKCANGINKLEEMIEAMFLFGLKPRQIEPVLHRQSKVHAIAVFNDGHAISHLSESDMWYAIQYSLTAPERRPCSLPAVSFDNLDLSFREMDFDRYPILALAPAIMEVGGTLFAVAEGAGTQAVNEFLKRYGKDRRDEAERHGIKFTEISEIQREVILMHRPKEPTLENVLAANKWAAEKAAELAEKIRKDRARKDFAL